MIKQLTFVRRAAGLAPEEFFRRWQEDTRATLATMPPGARPRRLAHCAVRHGRRPLDHDGVAISWFDDEDALADHDMRATENGAGSAIDDTATTVVRVEERTVFGDAWLDERWHQHAGTPQLVLIGLIEAVDELSRREFADYWWSQHRPLANQLVPSALQPVAYVHDYVLPGEATAWAGIGEMYESSLDVARQRGAWFDSSAATALLADEDRFLVRSTRQLLITEQHMLINEGVIT